MFIASVVKLQAKSGRSELTGDIPPHPSNKIRHAVVYPNAENK